MTVTYLLIIAFSAFFFSSIGTVAVRNLLERLNILDHPEERSNHEMPTPRGGGLAVVFSMLCFMAAVRAPALLLLAIVIVAVISFMDDVKRQPVKTRLMVHAIAALCAVMALHYPVFQGLFPYWMDSIIAALLLMWFMNLFNFMDGIDEISVMQAVSICLGAMLLETSVEDLPRSLIFDGAAVVGAMFGFWLMNRHPAKIFLGDVGSVPVGLTLGFFLLEIAGRGYWEAALIVPAYYLTDSGMTLVSRLIRGQNIAASHSDHGYQKAVRSGWSHPQVVEHIFALNLALFALAVVSAKLPEYGFLPLIAAYALSVALRFYFMTRRGNSVSHEVVQA
ncbi:MAG: glycosyltransferase family 4 protein [Rickettsiales bacterium]